MPVVGFATALAVLCKFSNIPFLGACYVVGFVLRIAGYRPPASGAGRPSGVRRVVPDVGRVPIHLIPLGTVYGPHPRIDSMLSNRPLLHKIWDAVMATPLPLTEVMMGVRDLYRHNALGIDMYLLGQWSQSGWWYFFPVVLAVKTPIGLLLLAACGFGFVLRRWRETLGSRCSPRFSRS